MAALRAAIFFNQVLLSTELLLQTQVARHVFANDIEF